MIALIHKGGDKIPVAVEGLDDPKIGRLVDEHGAGAVVIDGVSMAERAAEAEAKAAAEAEATPATEAEAKAAAEAEATPATKRGK